jgi:hypothetical protein
VGPALAVLYGDGKGGFGAEHLFPVVDGPHVPIGADWNQDGAPDIAVASSIGGSPSAQAISFLLNRTGESATLALSSNPAQYGNGNSSAFSEVVTDFSLSASTPSLTLPAGASGTYTLQLSPLSGFSGSVELAGTGAPELATCAASPASVQVRSGSSYRHPVTTAGTSAALPCDHDVQARALLNATAMTSLLGFVGLFAGFTTRRGPAVTLFALLLMRGMSACGGSSTHATAPQTPSGTSTLTITATTAANGVTVDHMLELALIVK